MITYNVAKDVYLPRAFYYLVFVKKGLKAYLSINHQDNDRLLLVRENSFPLILENPITFTKNCQFSIFENVAHTISTIRSTGQFTFEEAFDYYLELMGCLGNTTTLMYFHLCQYEFKFDELLYIKNHDRLNIISYTEKIDTRESVQLHILAKIDFSDIKNDKKEDIYGVYLMSKIKIIDFNKNVFNIPMNYLDSLFNYNYRIKYSLINNEKNNENFKKYLSGTEKMYKDFVDLLNKHKIDETIMFI